MWKYFPFFTNLKLLIIGIVYRFFLAGAWYLPISIFVIAFVIAVVTAIVLAIKRKSGLILLLFLGLVLAVFAMSIVKGESTPYRMCSPFCVFTGFIFMLLALLLKGKGLKIAYGVLMVILVLNQSRSLNNWFVNDYQRYEHDKEVLLNVATEIEKNHDATKPVVFVGTIKLAPQIKKFKLTALHLLTGAAAGVLFRVPKISNSCFARDTHLIRLPKNRLKPRGKLPKPCRASIRNPVILKKPMISSSYTSAEIIITKTISAKMSRMLMTLM